MFITPALLAQLPRADKSYGPDRTTVPPGTEAQPTRPDLTEPGTGMLIVDWDSSRRATGYRVAIQVPGESVPRIFGLCADDQTTLTGLPLGVLHPVTAHNKWGDAPQAPQPPSR